MIDLGIFKEFWNEHPNHLPFLNLNSQDSEDSECNLIKSIQRLDLLCNNHSETEVEDGIEKLLNEENWRPHLVGILASFKLPLDRQQIFIPMFWERLEKGSWISPQILAVLYMIDSDFEIKAKKILQDGFEVKFSPMSMIEHHSARGPEGNKSAAEKVINTIKFILEYKEDDYGWKRSLVELIESKKFETNIM